MTEPLYFSDSYLKEFTARVTEVVDHGVVLDRTAFYPQGGGQPSDTGILLRGTEEFGVSSVVKKEGKIVHELPAYGLQVGDNVIGKINWERRYTLMRMHTSAHLLSALFYSRARVLITGNQLDVTKSRMDFNLEILDKEMIDCLVIEANAAIAQQVPVKVYSLPRAEALSRPEIVKLANALPPNIDVLRIVEIEGIDIQADGGTHVKQLGEIGFITLLSVENKGKNNRRLYFTVK